MTSLTTSSVVNKTSYKKKELLLKIKMLKRRYAGQGDQRSAAEDIEDTTEDMTEAELQDIYDKAVTRVVDAQKLAETKCATIIAAALYEFLQPKAGTPVPGYAQQIASMLAKIQDRQEMRSVMVEHPHLENIMAAMTKIKRPPNTENDPMSFLRLLSGQTNFEPLTEDQTLAMREFFLSGGRNHQEMMTSESMLGLSLATSGNLACALL
jgi:hypothetical protein